MLLQKRAQVGAAPPMRALTWDSFSQVTVGHPRSPPKSHRLTGADGSNVLPS